MDIVDISSCERGKVEARDTRRVKREERRKKNGIGQCSTQSAVGSLYGSDKGQIDFLNAAIQEQGLLYLSFLQKARREREQERELSFLMHGGDCIIDHAPVR